MKEEKTENESEYYCDDFNDEDRVLKWSEVRLEKRDDLQSESQFGD
jgi:hypothetical protein